MLAAIAELEREVIREQMDENKMAKWREYRTFIGKPPFGYRWNKTTRRLEIDEKEERIYTQIVAMYLGPRPVHEGYRPPASVKKASSARMLLSHPIRSPMSSRTPVTMAITS